MVLSMQDMLSDDFQVVSVLIRSIMGVMRVITMWWTSTRPLYSVSKLTSEVRGNHPQIYVETQGEAMDPVS